MSCFLFTKAFSCDFLKSFPSTKCNEQNLQQLPCRPQPPMPAAVLPRFSATENNIPEWEGTNNSAPCTCGVTSLTLHRSSHQSGFILSRCDRVGSTSCQFPKKGHPRCQSSTSKPYDVNWTLTFKMQVRFSIYTCQCCMIGGILDTALRGERGGGPKLCYSIRRTEERRCLFIEIERRKYLDIKYFPPSTCPPDFSGHNAHSCSDRPCNPSPNTKHMQEMPFFKLSNVISCTFHLYIFKLCR